MNVGGFLDIVGRCFSDKEAVVSEEARYTYRQLKDRVQRLMAVLERLDVKVGDRVAALMWNSAEFIEVYLATIRLGAVFLPLNYRLKKPELDLIIKDSQPRVLITDEQHENLANELASDVSGVQHLISTSGSPTERFSPYRDLVSASHAFAGRVSIRSDDPCQLLYTSGTTGRPKGVILSHENIFWNTMNMLQIRCDRAQDVALIVAPLFHVAALDSHYTTRLALGATSVLMDKFDALHLMELVQQEKITVISGSPTIFSMLIENCSPGQYNTSSVSTLTSGADKLSDHIKRELLEFFPNAEGIYDVYGSTECLCVTTLSARDSFLKSGSVGPPLPFLEISLVDDNRLEVPMGQVGEIAVRGGNVMKGYYRQPEETAKFLKDEWFYTGDLARADEDGYLYIVDRKKDIIISGGENVSPKDVEEVICSHPAVSRAAVFGLPDPKWGERVTAAVVRVKKEGITSEQLSHYLKNRIAGYKVPKEFFFLDKLPEGGTGKVQKDSLRKMYAHKDY